MRSHDDPTLRNARREAWILLSAWAAATLYCCVSSYITGYIRPDRPLGADDTLPVFGIPAWFFWSVIVPWGVCGVFTLIFVVFFMKEDDLGRDHATELEADIREAGHHAE